MAEGRHAAREGHAILRGRATGEDHDETVEMLDTLDALFEARRGETLMSFVDGEDVDAGRWPKTIRDITATEVLDKPTFTILRMTDELAPLADLPCTVRGAAAV